MKIPKIYWDYILGRHIIFYQFIEKDEIEIIRILRERMDLKSRMNG